MPPPPLDRVPWWLWPTVLCFDAPAVALSWQALLAGEAGVSLRPRHAVLLALAVWLAYAADRWIEGWRLTPRTVRTRRHYFYMRRRWPAFAVWCVALLAGVALAGATFDAREWAGSLSLLAAVLLYLLSHQLLHRHHPARVPKEVCVALLIAAGAALYPATSRPEAWGALLPGFAWLMALGLLNCLLIGHWEREVDRSHGQSSLALHSSAVGDVLPALPVFALAGALACAVWGPRAARGASAAAAVSAAFLAVLAKVQPALGRERARVLADVALLSPLLVLAFS